MIVSMSIVEYVERQAASNASYAVSTSAINFYRCTLS